MRTTERLYDALISEEGVDDDVPDAVSDAAPANAARIISALTLQKIGDRIADPKTVLAWLLGALAAPTVLVGLLVPVRESGALLPQAVLTGRVKQRELRKTVWSAGAVGQGLSIAAIAAVAATLRGVTAGVLVVLSLAAFAVSRSLSSIAYKDVLGRTIPKGARGQVGGLASAVSGVVAIALGLGLRLIGSDAQAEVLAILLAVAAVMWALAAAVFMQVAEPAGRGDPDDEGGLREAWRLLRDDDHLRRFVTARALLLVSALSPPFLVSIASGSGASALGALGLFVVAQGLASMVGGRLWGRHADRSSRRTMVLASAGASAVVVVFLAAEQVLSGQTWLYPLAYFLLALAHEGARLGRSTYVTDMAEGDLRTAYVAASNSAMGVLLLVAGVISGAVALLGAELALLLLAVGGVAGAVVGRTLPEVSAGS